MTIVGAVTYLRLPVAQFPNIVPPEIQVKTTYTGADALTVEQSVATPIEQQMSGVDNMNYMQSVNGNDGTLKLTVNFEVGTDVNTDQILSQMRVNQASSQLPGDVNKFGVTVKKSTSTPLIMFALHSPKGTYDNVFLANYANINLNDEFMRVPGISSVTVFGAGQYAMRIWVKPDQLAKLGLTVPEIIDAVGTQNAVNPAGHDRRRAHPERAGIHVCGACPGTVADGGGIRRDRRPRQPRRLDAAAEGRSPHRAGRAELRDQRPAQRQTCRARRALSVTRLKRGRGRGGSAQDDGATRGKVSQPILNTSLASTPRSP